MTAATRYDGLLIGVITANLRLFRSRISGPSYTLMRRAHRNMKSVLDSLLTSLGLLVYAIGLAGPLTRANRRSPKVLMYHAVDEAENDFSRGLSINTTPAQFASHLAFLSRHYRIVNLAELLEVRPTEPTVAITFDDGFRSVHEQAWPILRKHRAAATCY